MADRTAKDMEEELRVLLVAREAPNAVDVMQRIEGLQKQIAHLRATTLPESPELRFVACSMQLASAIESAHRRGFRRDEVLGAAGFVLGVTYRRAGRSLPAKASVREAVPEILEGFRREAIDAATREPAARVERGGMRWPG